ELNPFSAKSFGEEVRQLVLRYELPYFRPFELIELFLHCFNPAGLSQSIFIRLGFHKSKESIIVAEKSLLMYLQSCGNWSSELTDYVVKWMILSLFAIVFRNLVIGMHNCKPVDSASYGATTSSIGAITSGAGGSTLGGGGNPSESTEGTPQFGPERPRVYSDINSNERDWYNADIRATNILLQGFPKDIYTLINHYTDAKDIWDNVKMLLEGSELTKEDRESQLFSKLINDMRNIKMTMPKLQLNSKFVNNMLPEWEWGRFVMAVKLNRGMRESNYDQLFAYLKQHEAHAKENKMVLERLSQPIAQPTADPLALLSNVSNTQHGSPSLSTSSITLGGNAAGYGEAQNKVRNVNQGQARPGQNSEYFKDKMLLMQAQENGVALDVEQLLFLAGGPDNAFDDDVDEQPVKDLALNEEHVMHDSVQLDHVVDLHADHTSISNMIPYDQYVKDIDVSVVHNNASSVLNDTFMMMYDDMCESIAPSVSNS
nr:hypothetical protein [Tanacetum cinerariifolium]